MGGKKLVMMGGEEKEDSFPSLWGEKGSLVEIYISVYSLPGKYTSSASSSQGGWKNIISVSQYVFNIINDIVIFCAKNNNTKNDTENDTLTVILTL